MKSVLLLEAEIWMLQNGIFSIFKIYLNFANLIDRLYLFLESLKGVLCYIGYKNVSHIKGIVYSLESILLHTTFLHLNGKICQL